MTRYRFRCTVEGASEADVQRWLANHAHGAHWVYVNASLSYSEVPTLVVHLSDERDRFALRAAFDVVKTEFTSSFT